MSQTLYYIKPDAVFPVEIGTGYLQRLQKLSLSLLQDKSEAEIKELSELIKENKVQPDTWQFHYETIAMFMKAAEQAAQEHNCVITEQGDLLSDPAQ